MPIARMKAPSRTFRASRPRLRESGQGLTEYLILLLLVSVVSIAAVKSLGGTVKRKIQQARKSIHQEVVIE